MMEKKKYIIKAIFVSSFDRLYKKKKVICVINYIDWELLKRIAGNFYSVDLLFFISYWFTTKLKKITVNHCFNLFIYTKLHQFRRNNLI